MGKGKKRGGTKIGLGDFLGETANTVNIGGNVVELPSAPKAATLEIDVTKLPRDPPFTAELANLPYDITEEQVWNFFGDLKISKIDIPREDEDGRFKGKAFIIVDGKRDAAIETLAHVLAKTDNILMGRRIRIEIYQPRRSDDRRGGPRDDPNFGRSDKGGWRRDASPPRRDDRYGRDDRGGGYGRGGYDRRDDRGGYDDRRGGGGGYDDRRGYDDRSRGGYGGGGYDRRDDRGGGYDRGYDRRDDRGGYDRGYDRDRSYGGRGYDHYGGGRDYRGDDRRGGYRPSPSEDDRSWRRAEPEIPDRPDLRREERSRPKLQLQARTKPVEETQNQKSARPVSSNPFGAAKAVDTSAKEKEIEQKLKETTISDNSKPKKEYVKKLTAEERAAQKAEELKKQIESGVSVSEEEKEKTEIGTKSRFDLLDEECP